MTSKKRRLAISLRVFLLLVLATGAGIGWEANRARKQRQAVEIIQRYGGDARYDWEYTPDLTRWSSRENPPGPRWLRELMGDEYFQDVVRVSLQRPPLEGLTTDGQAVLDQLVAFPKLVGLDVEDDLACDEAMLRIGRLRQLRELSLWSGRSLTEAGLSRVGLLGELRELRISMMETPIQGLAWVDGLSDLRCLKIPLLRPTDQDLAHFRRLTKLQELDINNMDGESDISDDGLASLSGLTNLEILGLPSSKVTDRGLEHLMALKKLRVLVMGNSHVTDRGFEHLKDLKMLKELYLRRSPLTSEGIKRFRAARPDVKVFQ